MNKKNRILSIDGGGSRGIIPAVMLNNIYNDTGVYPTEFFDVLTGTSTGGIITLALAVGIPTSELVDLYLLESEKIFADSFWDNMKDAYSLFGANYSNDYLAGVADKYFGNKTLRDIHFRHKGKKVFMVPTFDLNPMRDGRHENFRPEVYNSCYIKFEDVRLRDIALRTSAAPTFLPIVDKKYIDGGVAINHPALSALSFAVSSNESSKEQYRYEAPRKKGLFWDILNTKVLSLGCGTSNGSFVAEEEVDTGDWGLWQWRHHIANLMVESNVACSEYYVRQLLPEYHYLRLQPDFSNSPAFVHLRGKKLDLDVRDEETLEQMREATNAYYEANKEHILRIISEEEADSLEGYV